MKAKPVILVVDDQPKNIELLEAYLVPQGYEIVKAANGEEALGKLSGNQIDLILLDVKMPGMDGFEVIRRVRQDNTHRLLPIILVTVLRETEDRVKGIEAGCDEFISYPIDKMELLARVRSLLKVKVYNDLMSNYQKELESEVTRRTDELKHSLENLQQEITEHSRTEEALRRSEARYRALFETSADGILVADIETKAFKYANPALCRMLGYTEEELRKMGVADIHPKEAFQKVVGEFEAQARGDKTLALDIPCLRKDGTILYVDINTTHIVIDDRLCNIGFFRDVTERKQAEELVIVNLKKIENTLEDTVKALAAISEMRDPYTAGHQRRVTQIACAIALDMGFSQDRINAIRIAGLLHDIGKITIPAEILTKPSKLSDVEFAIIKTHPKAAYDVLKSIDFPWPIAQYILQHHEKLNGSGYPSGLKGDEILMESRILCVADIVEAMSSHRPYRPALGIDVALEDMFANKGVLYDPAVVDSCVKLFREKGFKFE